MAVTIDSREPCAACQATEKYIKTGRCAPCARKKALDVYYVDPAKRKACSTAWKRKNPERARRLTRKTWRADWLPGEHELAEAALAVATRCDVCSGTDPHHKRGWNADHSHETKRFRGIVCHPCNIAIAHVERFGMDRGAQIAAYLIRTIR